MKRILLTLMVILSFACGHAQNPSPLSVSKGVKITSPPTEKILIMDETWVVASGKTSFRIITSNEVISHQIMSRFEKNGMTKFTYTMKKDRKGPYWERSFYFKNDKWNTIVDFVNEMENMK